MKIIVAGGGTGGHIIPNIAILELLQSDAQRNDSDLKILYIGSKNGLESSLIPAKWEFRAISCGKLRRYFSFKNFTDFFKTIFGIIQSLFIVGRFRPDVIFCKGGYVGLPVAIAGGILHRPVIIHESDFNMGLANRIASLFARVICVSFPETAKKLSNDKRVVFTGNPIRNELFNGNKKMGYSFCGFKRDKPVLLVMGGSQGAMSINLMLKRNLDEILKKYQVFHICGKGNKDNDLVRKGYVQAEFVGEELKDVYAIADFVISRAGANSLAEISALKIPALLIPLFLGSRGDQIKNAASFTKNHIAIICSDNEISQKNFSLCEKLSLLERNLHSKSKCIYHAGKNCSNTSKNNLKSNKRVLEKPAVEKIVEIIKSFSLKNDKKN